MIYGKGFYRCLSVSLKMVVHSLQQITVSLFILKLYNKTVKIYGYTNFLLLVHCKGEIS